MARPSVNILFNITTNDTECTNPAGDSNFLLLGTGDFLVWRDSQQVTGDLLSGVSYPTILPEADDTEALKLFVMDDSAGEYIEVPLAGTEISAEGGDNQYVCAAWFSGPTATVPYLEAYDDDSHATWESMPLGNGVPADSVFKAVVTTNGLPGSATWVGTPLAGTDSRIALETTAIPGIQYVYWNMKEILTVAMASWPAADWYKNDLVLAIHYTYS
jgi:hypothetical protein